MNGRIRELAEQAGITLSQKDYSYYWVESAEDIEKFAELIAAEEREACAKMCEYLDAEYEGEDVLGTWCAAAIQARGNE